MITATRGQASGRKFCQVFAALGVALSILLYTGPDRATAAVTIDEFHTSSVPFRNVQQTGVGATNNVETGIPGTIGGTRQTTVTVTAGAATARARIFNGSPFGSLQYTTSGVASNLMLLYNANGAGLAANVVPFAGISVPFAAVALGGALALPVTATLSDGTDSATATVNITAEGAQTLIIPASAFGAALAAVDLTNLSSVKLTFDAALGQEFTLAGPIQFLTPEPLAVIGLAVVLLVGLAGWLFFGRRLSIAV